MTTLKVEGYRLSQLSPRSPITFQVQGRGIEAVQMEIFDLSGRKTFDCGWTGGSQLKWNLVNVHGRPVANGVYLY